MANDPIGIVVGAGIVNIRADVVADADWADDLPALFDEDGAAFNLTGMTMEIYVRPTFDYSTLLLKLSSAGSDGIVIDTPTDGLSQVRVPRADLIAAVPVGSWEWFCRLLEPDGVYAPYLIRELWRGPFNLYPGRTTL